MLKLVKDSFRLTNKYLVLSTPLIFFLILSSLYLMLSGNSGVLSSLITLILFLLMLSAFLSGWFYMIAKAVKEPDVENADALIMEFPAGVGEYFLPTFGLLFVISVVTVVVMSISTIIGIKFIGIPNVDVNALNNISNAELFNEFMKSLPQEAAQKMNYWIYLIVGSTTFISLITMFYYPCCIFKHNNPFKAYFVSLKDLFSHKFFSNLILFIIITLMNMFLSVASALLNPNIVTNFVLMIIKFYLVTYIAVLVFNYYYSTFVKKGSNVDEIV